METKRNENDKASSDVDKGLEKQGISEVNTSFQIDPCKPPVKLCPVSSTETSKSEFEIVEKFPLCSVDLRKGKFCTKRYKKYRSAEDFYRHYYYKSHNKKFRKRLHSTNKRYGIEHFEDQNCKAAMQLAINFEDIGTNSSSKNEEFSVESQKQSVMSKQSLEHQHVSRRSHSRSPSTSDHSPNESSFTSSSTGDVEVIIVQALERMDRSLHRLLHRMSSVEHNMEAVVQSHRLPWWCQLAPNKATLFWIAWPILVNFIFSAFWRRKLYKKIENVKCFPS